MKRLEQISQLAAIAAASADRPQLLFKHSTRCSISASAKYRLESDLPLLEQSMDVHLLDLILHRDISAEIASMFGVRHESPQVILLQHGNSVLDLSHYDIDAAAILRPLQAPGASKA